MDTRISINIRTYVQSFLAFTFLVLLISAPKARAQQMLKTLTEADYNRWGFLISDNISDKGNWTSFRVKNPAGDTIFVKNAATARKFAIAGGAEGKFNGEDYFASISSDTLVVVNLKTGTVRKYPDCQFFDFNDRDHRLLMLSKYGDGGHTLTVLSASGQVEAKIGNVESWKWNAEHSKMAIAYRKGESHGVAIIGDEKRAKAIKEGSAPYSGLAWGGDYLSFIESDKDSEGLYLYNAKTGVLRQSGTSSGQQFPQGMKLLGDYDFTVVSGDGSRVIFALSEIPSVAQESLVQIWHADDKQLYPRKQMYGDVYLQHKFGVWDVATDRIRMISDRQYPMACGSATSSKALVWDPMHYEPQSDYDGPYDLYLMDLGIGSRTKVIANEKGNSQGFFLDPQGSYIYYSRDYHWWVYDIKKERHRNLTGNINVPFDMRNYDRAGRRPMYGLGGLARNGSSLIAYDQYDAWELPADGSPARLLTPGRGSQTTYRLAETAPEHMRRMHGYVNQLGSYTTDGPMVFYVSNRKEAFEGYCLRKGNGKWTVLYQADQQLESLAKASNATVFTFTAQRYNLPPQLVTVQPGSKPAVIYRSNPHQYEYYWGRSEIVHYEVEGKSLTGVLIFPANYKRDQVYPMIVSIYEKQTYLYNSYVNPSISNMTGFNPTNLSSKGYFVLLPDIAYRMREMGDSAKDCVLAAVDAVLKDYPVDPGRLGLTGHSFGGYETDYIITQTDRFKAAISGAAITDLVSSYLYVGGNHGRPDFWRFEHQQQRMEKSLFEGMNSYLDNSPILQAKNVTTPLLSWTGENDRHVNYLQSVEFYLALRRAGKKHTLLIYPGEEHVLIDPLKQQDLTRRFEAWFDHYLKK